MTSQPTRRAAAWLWLGLLAALSASILLPAVPTMAATASVAVENYDFAPASRTVQVGDTVRWTFSGDQHSVTSRDGLFDSGIKDPGASFQFRFTTAGTFRYYCVVHPGLMSGTIVVKAASATPRPTVRPTLTPRPTPRPTVRATIKPAATPTPTPSPSPATATPSTRVSPSLAPSPSVSAAPSEALVVSSTPSNAPPSTAPVSEPSASSGDATPIVAGAVLLVLVAVVGGWLLARRRRAI